MRDQNMYLTQLKSVSRTRILLQLSPLINPQLKLQLAQMMMMMMITLQDKFHFQHNQVHFLKNFRVYSVLVTVDNMYWHGFVM